MKKVLLGTISVICLSTTVVIGSSLINVSADDSVTMEMFNELKSKVEVLETQLSNANDEITTLKTANEKLVSIEEKTNQNESKITTITSEMNNITKRTSKIEAREKYFYTESQNLACGAVGCNRVIQNTSKHILDNMQ